MPTYREILNLPTGDFRPAMAGYDAADDMMKVKSIQKKMRDSFTRPVTELWDVVTSGGMTVTNTAGMLTIASGTTAGGYAELLSKETFTIPFRAMYGVLNTRHASNHQLIEAVSVDPITGIPDGKHSIDMDIGGAASATVTQMIYGTQNGGLRSLRSAAATIATTATLTILELEPFSDEAYFHSRAADSTAGRSASYARHQQIPDPTAVFKLRIRSMNHTAWVDTITNAVAGTASKIRLTATAHGRANGNVIWVEQLNGVTNNGSEVRGNFTVTVIDANTMELDGTVFDGVYVTGSGRWALASAPTAVNLQMQFANCQDYAELTAEITAGRGNIVEGQALAARMVAGSTTAVTGTVTATSTPATPSVTNVNSAATTNATLVKATAGNLYSLAVSNINAAARYVKLYNKATAPTVGTDVPVLTLIIPAGSTQVFKFGAMGMRFATGIGLAITAGAADADVAAVVAAEVKVSAHYI